MATGDIYRLVASGAIADRPFSTTFHLLEAAPTSLDNYDAAEELVQELKDWYSGDLAAILSSDFALTAIDGNQIEPVKGNRASIAGSNYPVNGALSTDAVPSLAAVVVSLRTFEASRNGRGRVYLPGLPQTDEDSGTLIDVTRDAWLSSVTNWFGFQKQDSTGGTFYPSVYSRKLGVAYPLAGVEVRINLGTQRRRRRRAYVAPTAESP